MEIIGNCKLEKIIIYPIKSCAGLEVSSWHANNEGLKFDRYWCIMNQDNKKIIANKYPILSLIYPDIDIEFSYLSLSYLDQYISIPLTKINETDYTLVNKWLSLIIGENCYLISQEKINKNFSNQGNIHLINQNSIRDLQSKISDREISYLNFRPNLVVTLDTPYSEDKVVSYLINDSLRLRFVNKCRRCSVINIQNGLMKSSDVYKKLSQYRISQKSVYFGVLVTIDHTNSLIDYEKINTFEY